MNTQGHFHQFDRHVDEDILGDKLFQKEDQNIYGSGGIGSFVNDQL